MLVVLYLRNEAKLSQQLERMILLCSTWCGSAKGSTNNIQNNNNNNNKKVWRQWFSLDLEIYFKPKFDSSDVLLDLISCLNNDFVNICLNRFIRFDPLLLLSLNSSVNTQNCFGLSLSDVFLVWDTKYMQYTVHSKKKWFIIKWGTGSLSFRFSSLKLPLNESTACHMVRMIQLCRGVVAMMI